MKRKEILKILNNQFFDMKILDYEILHNEIFLYMTDKELKERLNLYIKNQNKLSKLLKGIINYEQHN